MKKRRRNRTGESKYSARRLRAAQKQLQALSMRMSGASYPTIARKLGYKDHTGAYRAIEAGLAKSFEEPAARVRKIDTARCERIILAYWEKAIAGDDKAAAVVDRFMDRKARIIGLYAPTEMKHTGEVRLAILEEAKRRYAGRGKKETN